jgi:hypothetical protein
MPSIFALPPFIGNAAAGDFVHVGDKSDQLDKAATYDQLFKMQLGSGANSLNQSEGSGDATNTFSMATGGNATSSGNNSRAHGDTVTASGDYSDGQGHNVTASGQSSHAGGQRSVARRFCEWARSAFRFAANGDAQIGMFHASNQTVDAVPTPLFLDGTGATQGIDLADNSAIVVHALVTARHTGANEAAGYRLSILVRRDVGAGTTAIVGAQEKVVLGEDDAAWDANLVANAVFGGVGILVTGAGGKTINWSAKLDTSEIVT